MISSLLRRYTCVSCSGVCDSADKTVDGSENASATCSLDVCKRLGSSSQLKVILSCCSLTGISYAIISEEMRIGRCSHANALYAVAGTGMYVHAVRELLVLNFRR